MSNPLPWLWYEFVSWFCLTGLTLGFSLRMKGRQNIPQHGPVLIIANHQSFLDPIIIGSSLPRHVIYLARKTLFKNPLFGALLRSLCAVPIDQEGLGKEGLLIILKELQKGNAVVVFPEGERTLDGVMHGLRPGIHLLIKRVKAPILPMGIAGAYAAWPRGKPCPIPAPLFTSPWDGTLAVVIGKPIDGNRYTDVPRADVLTELFDRLQEVQHQAEDLRRK